MIFLWTEAYYILFANLLSTETTTATTKVTTTTENNVELEPVPEICNDGYLKENFEKPGKSGKPGKPKSLDSLDGLETLVQRNQQTTTVVNYQNTGCRRLHPLIALR